MPRATRGALVEGDASIITFVEWLDLQQPEGDRIVLSPVSATAVFIRADREDYVREEVRRYVGSMSSLRNKTDVDDEDDGLGEAADPQPTGAASTSKRSRARAPRGTSQGGRGKEGRPATSAAAGEAADEESVERSSDEGSVVYAEDDEEY